MKKILFYNWDELERDHNRGGGVSVYLKNLINALISTEQYEIWYLSAGRVYDLKNIECRIEKCNNCFGEDCKSYRIVNAPVLAPAVLSFHSTDKFLNDKIIYTVLSNFLRENGGFDIVHFHNIEGLSCESLSLKKDFKHTKFIYTLHNYYLFCPESGLWENNMQNCTCCFDRKKECDTCVADDVIEDKVKAKLYYNRLLKEMPDKKECEKLRLLLEEAETGYGSKSFASQKIKGENAYQNFCKKNVYMINLYMDRILAVSERTLQIAVKSGVKKEKLVLAYIGTKEAENYHPKSVYRERTLPLRMVYAGYMRKNKGFYFFVDALEQMSEDMARNIEITIIAKQTDESALKRLQEMKSKFANVTLIDGYQQEELAGLLAKQHLGIVPVLWEDNLPQVAIEMVAYGVPILASDLGGAHELCDAKQFCFQAGNYKDFFQKIEAFLNNMDLLDSYWEKAKELKTMEQHLKELDAVYCS